MLKNTKLNLGIIVLFVCGVVIAFIINNGKYNRYIHEDMEQSTTRLNEFLDDNRSKLYEIIHSDTRPQVANEELIRLMIFHRDIERELFNLKKKGPLLKDDLGKSIESMWDKFSYNDETNTNKIKEYYGTLNKRINSNNYIELDEKDIGEMNRIFDFYNKTKEEVDKLKI